MLRTVRGLFEKKSHSQAVPNHYGLESAKPDLQSVFKKPGGGSAEL